MIFYRLYRLITLVLSPLIIVYIAGRLFRGKEHKLRWMERFGISKSPPSVSNKTIWLHAASVGESLSILPIIDALLKHTSSQIIITSGTVTSAEVIQSKISDSRVRHLFIPIDTPWAVSAFLKRTSPTLAIFVESEIWPNLIMQAAQKGTKLLLINARLSHKSAARWSMIKSLPTLLFSKFSLIIPQSKSDMENLRSIGAPTDIMPFTTNIKYGVDALSASAAETESLKSQIMDRPCWLAASTHEGEEKIIIQVHNLLKARFPDVLTIIAPRHPKRIESIISSIEIPRNNIALRSYNEPITSITEIYLADTIGEMGLLYRISKVCFIGGSLAPVGGHNPIEPAKLGCAIITGLHLHNFTSIYDDFRNANACIIATDFSGIADKIMLMLNDDNARTTLITNAKKLVDSKSNAAEQVIAETLQCL